MRKRISMHRSPGVVDEDAVHALLDGVEEPHLLPVNVDDDACVPAVAVLVVPARVDGLDGLDGLD